MATANDNQRISEGEPSGVIQSARELEATPSLPSIDSDSSSDADSASGGMSARSSTASLRSSIYENVEENGRTYHRYKQGKYPLPNDAQEQERLDLQHRLFMLTFHGRLNLAPIPPNPPHVLDIATGTGMWAIEFAHEHPNSRVLGTDLSAIQPLYVPPNCHFEIDDAEDEWIFSQKFDYIHGRALVSCFKDPSQVIREAFKSLQPGGYLELQDGIFPFQYIGDLPTESSIYKWNELVMAAAAKAGRPWTNVQHYKRWMEDIGFENVVEKSFYWPIGPWAKGKYYKDIGMLCQEDVGNVIEPSSLKLIGSLGWSSEQIQEIIRGVRDDLQNSSIHIYIAIKLVYGRKPGGPPSA